MTLSLATFQSGFVEALFGRASDLPCAAQPAFAVYRNTVMKGCIDALEANYPSVARLIGSERFRAAAAVYVPRHPPRSGCLLDYGQGFANFLAGFEPARELFYLSDVARLDRAWIESHVAPDTDQAQFETLSALPPEALGRTQLVPPASARWHWFADAPIYTIWQHQREARPMPDNLTWRGEGALLVRPSDAVVWHPLSQADCQFLSACAQGRSLLDAAGDALAVQADADIGDMLSRLLRAGALVARPPEEESRP